MAMVLASPAAAVTHFSVSLETEQPGIQTSTSGFTAVGVENFESYGAGAGQTIISDFGETAVFSGTYSNVGVGNANRFGGAEGAGKFANAGSNVSYTLDLSTTLPQGVNYFGFWLSALDANNNLAFFQGGQQLFTFNAADVRTFVNGLPNRTDYFGNPNPAFTGQNTNEPYVFLNFYARGNTRFDRIVFSQGPSGGYESDNHTVGRWSRISGTVIAGNNVVPEPASWAMLIAGFGLVGMAARRRRAIALA
ncbi:MAG: PEPxxWA-CTERM sorting domain-containing protein [Polymorphobacter sp.]|uniref:Npun_F0296 family exosortase-dependent surface protein n=1 Tax=Polymorphobacter sp. TaxID=1909290 RepID=UPI003A855724